MKVLILTPTNDIDIAIFGAKLHQAYDGLAHIFSAQEMGILLGATMGKNETNWSAYEYQTAITARDDDNILRNDKDKLPIIVYGNLDKHSVNFNHILSVAEPGWDWDTEASERAKLDKLYNPVLEQCGKRTIEWYEPKDVQLTLPTFHHLQLFLKSAGIGGKKVGK